MSWYINQVVTISRHALCSPVKMVVRKETYRGWLSVRLYADLDMNNDAPEEINM